MKCLIILADGMADEPCQELDGLTPIEAAHSPAFDTLAREGRCGLLETIPEGFSPGSEIAHLSLLGYDVASVYEGRGVLEAAGMGIDIAPDEMALRCNLITLTPDGVIKDYSSGHISNDEASELIKTLNEALCDNRASFHSGLSYRNLLKIKNGDKRINCLPPQDILGRKAVDSMTTALTSDTQETANYINNLILQSQKILAKHPVNLQRIREGKDPANSIWLWSPGYKPAMKTMDDMYGIRKGYVISAVDLIKGIGVYAGLTPIYVDGATGHYDTNYEGKAKAAIKALKDGADFVFLHIEASDEASHEGDVLLKKKIIEDIDHRVVAPILEGIKELENDLSIALLPDHPTLCRIRNHTSSAVPFVIWRKDLEPDSVMVYSERAASMGSYGLIRGNKFIKYVLTNIS